MLTKSKPEDAQRLWKMAQQDVETRYRMYEYMASRKTEAQAAAKDAPEKPAPAAGKPIPTGATR
jgi:pyruvate-ferredoxin/flavodoxin oxidoreductase